MSSVDAVMTHVLLVEHVLELRAVVWQALRWRAVASTAVVPSSLVSGWS